MTSDQPDLLDYPNSPGFKRGETSAEAAQTVLREVGRLQLAVLLEIRRAGAAGLTADEAGFNLGLSPFSARPRCTELSRQGQIRDSGDRRANISGRRAIVWVAATPGEHAAALAAAEREARMRHVANEAERQVGRVMREKDR